MSEPILNILINMGFSLGEPKKIKPGDVWVRPFRDDCAHIIGFNGDELEAVSIISDGSKPVRDFVQQGVSLWRDKASIPLPDTIRI